MVRDMTDPSSVAPGAAEPAGTGSGRGGRPGHRRRWIAAAGLAAVAAAGIAAGITGTRTGGGAGGGGVSDNAYPTSTATVTRQSLSSEIPVTATLGYAGSYTVVNQASGILTRLPQIGKVVSEGQVLYEVSGRPVVLLYGATPAYRSLSAGTTSAVTGPDVRELNADLVAMGYASSSQIPAGSAVFSSWTTAGVEKLQSALGVTANGTLGLGQAVFLPGAARVTSVSATLGASAPAGQAIMSATSTDRMVTVDLDSAQQSEVAVGDHVTITLPDNETTPGVVTSVGKVATSSSPGSSNTGGPGSAGPATITVLVTPTDPAATGTWDRAPVTVDITTASVHDALVVPVDALLALSGGGYAVEVVAADGVHRLVPVTLGTFDDADGLVQVSGSGLSAGAAVVVPGI
jgi:HlyD family secretion protein